MRIWRRSYTAPILDEGESDDPEGKKRVVKKRKEASKYRRAAPEEQHLSPGPSSSTTQRNPVKKAGSARKRQPSGKKLSVLHRDASKDAV